MASVFQQSPSKLSAFAMRRGDATIHEAAGGMTFRSWARSQSLSRSLQRPSL